jgi:tetratricopeptide (TPR) repeat protein
MNPGLRSSDSMRMAIVGLACIVAGVAPSASADERSDAKKAVLENLSAWDVPGAGRALEALVALSPGEADDVDVAFLKAQHAFLRSRYDDAVSLMESALKLAPEARELHDTLGLYRRTRDVVKDYKQVPTSGGHFVLALHPGVDEVLIPYADQALEAAYERLGEFFRYRPQEPVRVEIYPRVQNLADVSPLKGSEIRNSGTIALCKYNRLMIVSPRALVYGYDWLDTLAHEYIHLLVTRRSRNTVPIWLHEGMAKYFENRWREDDNATLARTSEDLLATAVKAKKLIRFEAMSPSMAKLPTQEDTALAFAEVFMVMDLLNEKGGTDAINLLLDLLRDGMTDREAVAKVSKKSFKRFQREWRNHLYQKNLRNLPTHAKTRMLFRDRAKTRDELKDIPEEQARQFTYIGDRLAVRKRFRAAAKEYRKALNAAGGPHPLISGKLASALLKQGQHQEVERIVGPAIELNRHHVLLYLYRGKARLAVGDYEKARDDLIGALRINPFDPEVHGLLAQAYRKLSNDEQADLEERQQQIVVAR